MATTPDTTASCSVEVLRDYHGVYGITIRFKRGQITVGYSEICIPNMERLFHFSDALRKGDNYKLFESEECIAGSRSLDLTSTHIAYHQANYNGRGSSIGGGGGAVERDIFGPLLLEELRAAKIYY